MDKIHIKKSGSICEAWGISRRNALGQKFVVSAVLYTSTREAGRADDLAKSIHYGEVSRVITEFMEQNTFQLLETAAERLAEELLLNTERLEKIRLEIKSPGPLWDCRWRPFLWRLNGAGIQLISLLAPIWEIRRPICALAWKACVLPGDAGWRQFRTSL